MMPRFVTSKYINNRRRLRNGYTQWLTLPTPKWKFTRGVGEEFHGREEMLCTDILEKYCTEDMLETVGREDVFNSMKEDFKVLGIDPLDMCSRMYGWVGLSTLAIMIIQKAAGGGSIADTTRGVVPPPTKADMEGWLDAGRAYSLCTYMTYNAWSCGSQIFSLSLPLASKLLLTDIGRLNMDDIQLPFQAFVIQVPQDSQIYITDPQTGNHILDTIIISQSAAFGYKEAINILFMGAENEQSEYLGDDCTFFISIDQNGTVEEAVTKCINQATSHNEALGYDGHKRATCFDIEGVDATKVLVNYALSVILYISSHPEDRAKFVNPEIKALKDKIKKLKGAKPKKVRQRNAAQEKLDEVLNLPRPMVVGTNVTISPELRDVARAIGSGKPPDVASFVRGHHKKQTYGTQGSLRKMIWIEPYWRGLELESKSQKTYTVK